MATIEKRPTTPSTPRMPPTSAKAPPPPPRAAQSTPKVSPLPPKPAPPKAAPGQTATPEQRYRMIQEAAYLLAEKDDFQGDPMSYWLEAEADIDAKLNTK